jgi:hypothetical protein
LLSWNTKDDKYEPDQLSQIKQAAWEEVERQRILGAWVEGLRSEDARLDRRRNAR